MVGSLCCKLLSDGVQLLLELDMLCRGQGQCCMMSEHLAYECFKRSKVVLSIVNLYLFPANVSNNIPVYRACRAMAVELKA